MSTPGRRSELTAQPASEGLTPVEARQGVKTGHMRWVLMISTAMAVIVLGGAFVWYSSVQQGGTPVTRHVATAQAQ
jgi:anti-sigma-K factor RskA